MLLTSRHSTTSIYDFKVWLLALSRLWPSLVASIHQPGRISSNGNGILLSDLRREKRFRDDALSKRASGEKYRVWGQAMRSILRGL